MDRTQLDSDCRGVAHRQLTGERRGTTVVRPDAQELLLVRLLDHPVVVEYTVDAGRLEAGSWYGDAELQGSRFVGEGDQFVDTISWWLGADPVEVSTTVVGTIGYLVCRLVYPDGSLGRSSSPLPRDAAYPKRPSLLSVRRRLPGCPTSDEPGSTGGGESGASVWDPWWRRQRAAPAARLVYRGGASGGPCPFGSNRFSVRPKRRLRLPRRRRRDWPSPSTSRQQLERRASPAATGPASVATDHPGRGGGACGRPLSPDDAANRRPSRQQSVVRITLFASPYQTATGTRGRWRSHHSRRPSAGGLLGGPWGAQT